MHTYTFPMYIFGQTSSTSFRCSLHESKTFCRSFTVRYSFLLSFRADILSPNAPSWIDYWSKCLLYQSGSRQLRLRMICASRCLSAVTGQLPNLVLNLACSLTRAEGRTTNRAARALLFTPLRDSNLISLKQR